MSRAASLLDLFSVPSRRCRSLRVRSSVLSGASVSSWAPLRPRVLPLPTAGKVRCLSLPLLAAPPPRAFVHIFPCRRSRGASYCVLIVDRGIANRC